MLELADEIEAVEQESSLPGLDRNFAGALCYVIGPAILLWFGSQRDSSRASGTSVRKEDRRVRFHAFQALLLAVSLLVVDLALHLIEAAAYRASWDAGLKASAILWWIYAAEVLFWLVAMFFGYELAPVRYLGLGRVAEQLAEGGRGTED